MAGEEAASDTDKKEEEKKDDEQGDEQDNPEVLAALDRQLHGSLDRYFAKFDTPEGDAKKDDGERHAAAAGGTGGSTGDTGDANPKAKARPEAKGESKEPFDVVGFLFGKR